MQRITSVTNVKDTLSKQLNSTKATVFRNQLNIPQDYNLASNSLLISFPSGEILHFKPSQASILKGMPILLFLNANAVFKSRLMYKFQ